MDGFPRYYASEKIGYVLGDASNAYGKVISPLWLTRGEQSRVHYTPENGWDENHVKTFPPSHCQFWERQDSSLSMTN